MPIAQMMIVFYTLIGENKVPGFFLHLIKILSGRSMRKQKKRGLVLGYARSMLVKNVDMYAKTMRRCFVPSA